MSMKADNRFGWKHHRGACLKKRLWPGDEAIDLRFSARVQIRSFMHQIAGFILTSIPSRVNSWEKIAVGRSSALRIFIRSSVFDLPLGQKTSGGDVGAIRNYFFPHIQASLHLPLQFFTCILFDGLIIFDPPPQYTCNDFPSASPFPHIHLDQTLNKEAPLCAFQLFSGSCCFS